MRKILLFLFMIVFPFTTTFAEEIDLNGKNILNSVVRPDAVRNALSLYPKVIEIPNDPDSVELFVEKGQFMDLVQKAYNKHGKITLKTINENCMKKGSAYGYPVEVNHNADGPRLIFNPSWVEEAEENRLYQGEVCMELVLDVVNEHNKLVSAQYADSDDSEDVEFDARKGKVFTSENEYNRALRNNGLCRYGENTTYTQPGSDEITLGKCKKYCKKVAVANACYLNSVYYDRDNGLRFGGTCECAYGANDVHVWQTGKTYYFMPTWEDYKKLFGIK